MGHPEPHLRHVGDIRCGAGRRLRLTVIPERRPRPLARGHAVVAQGDHGQHIPGLGGLFPHPAGLHRTAADALALIQQLSQHGKCFGSALFGCLLVVVERVGPLPGQSSLAALVQLFLAGLIGVPAGVEQAVEQAGIQRGRGRPRVQHDTVHLLAVQHFLHGVHQQQLRHGTGRRASVSLRRFHGGEDGQVVFAFLDPQGQVLRFFRRDRVFCPGGAPFL